MARNSLTKRYTRARAMLGDIQTGGLLITDPLEIVDEPKDQLPVAFRTLIQIDGDVCTTVQASALADPSFAEAHAHHMRHVDHELRERTAQLRRWTTLPAYVFGAAGLAATLLTDAHLGIVDALVEGAVAWLVRAGVGLAGGYIAALLGRTLVRVLMRRLMEHEALRRSP